jgi:hypothetical protein
VHIGWAVVVVIYLLTVGVTALPAVSIGSAVRLTGKNLSPQLKKASSLVAAAIKPDSMV